MPEGSAKFWDVSLFGSRALGIVFFTAIAVAGGWSVIKFWPTSHAERPSRPPGMHADRPLHPPTANGEPIAALPSEAGDSASAYWPQWRGPDRNEISRETGLLQNWPRGGPKLLWTFTNAGLGYSCPSIAGGRLFTLGAYGEKEYVYAIDAATGKELWSTEIGPAYSNSWGDGPRSTPTIDGDRVYALSAPGVLICVESATGKKIWHVDLHGDLGGGMPGWGFSESPLVDGDKVLCTPGGPRGTLAALNKQTGQVIWRSEHLREPAGYSSIIVAEAGGVRQYIQKTADSILGVAAADGALLWRSVVSQNRTAVIPTPIFHNNHVYATSGYGAGCGLLKLVHEGAEFKAEQVYANKIMKNQHGGVVLVGEHLYGYSDDRGWVCQEFSTGNEAWSSKKLAKGSLTYADGRLYCYSEDTGTVVLAEASPQGWMEHGRFTIPQETKQGRGQGAIWTHPVIAGGRLYLRDQDLIYCYEIKDRR